MAGCQECACKILVAIIAYSAISFATRHYTPAFTDLPTHIFQHHIRHSRHQPLCILFRQYGIGSKLEKIVYDLWKDPESESNYTQWEFGSFSPYENNVLPNDKIPLKLPAVRCYLGETSTHDYTGRVSKQGIIRWLLKLEDKYEEQNQEVSLESLRALKEESNIILLAFPDGPRHYEIEDMIYGLAKEFDSCQAVAVHHDSSNIVELSSAYGVKKYPSVVVIHTGDDQENTEEFQVFTNLDINQNSLSLYIRAKSLSLPLITYDLLTKYLYKQNTVQWQFKPVLMLLYAKWAKDSASHLAAFHITTSLYQNSDVNLRYGLLDLRSEASKDVVKKYFKMGALRNVPCTLLFYKGVNGNITYSILSSERPYPWVLYERFEALGNGMLDLTNVQEAVEPWASGSQIQFTPLYEGPYGNQCSVSYHNMTDNTPRKYKIRGKKKEVKKSPKKLTSFHHLFASEKIEQRLSQHEGIPLITEKTWSEVIEKSHARGHPFYKSRRWAGEVTKVAMVVFIMADCGSCRRANETFHELSKSVPYVEGGAMYLVNCTAEPQLCSKHNIRGFPIVTTFRGLGWMGTSNCMSQKGQKMFKNYVRLDYHGVIQAKPIMEWFSNVAASAVTDKKFEPVPDSFFDKDTRLVASLMPRMTHYLPIPPKRKKDYYFAYECLRLTCERLFGVIDCYSQYSREIPKREFAAADLDLIVTQIRLERRDGVKAVIMRFGSTLRQTLEDQSDDQLHHFHKPHRYNLQPKQRCEEDHAACTDLITDFVLDHSRLPVTPITSDIFHTSSSLFKEDNFPILMALVHPENITEESEFLQALTSVAYDFYDRVIVMTLDAKEYIWWSSKFVPANYGRLKVLDPDNTDPKSMDVFPRFCIVQKHDHRHAAFYPPLTRDRHRDEDFSREIIAEFVDDFLSAPEKLLVDTDQF